MLDTPFGEIAAILLIAAVVGVIGALMRQPLIVAFIAVGILVGPSALHLVRHAEELELLASIGIAVLLFLVGLRLDVSVIRTMGPVSLATGLGQVGFTSIIGFFLCLLLGMSVAASVYVAVALTFSSTIIIVKLLSDKHEIDALHGRIAVGFLIVQDIVVVLAMIALSAFGGAGADGDGQPPLGRALLVLARGLGMLGVVALMMRYVLPHLTRMMARHQELLILFAIAWAVALAATGEAMGTSREVGAFLAGVSLASTPYRDAIGGRLVSLRDFLLLFFFINLGATLDLSQIRGDLLPAAVLSIFVLVGNPLIVMVIMGAMGYRRRTGFLAGLTVAQISEFSLILGALGVSLGHIDPSVMGVITLVGLITIGLSTYMILYSHPLFERVAPLLGVFEKAQPYRESADSDQMAVQPDVIVFGLGRYGSNIAHRLEQRGLRVLGVDFDPQVIRRWRDEGRSAQYGDAEDPEFAATLPLARATWVISTMPQLHVNQALLSALHEQRYAGSVAATAHHHHDARRLEQLGAKVVLLPFSDAAEEAVDRILGEAPQDNKPRP
ncbi:MAG: cation:proton antiporter [Phycisphaeraceae bacterium]|nr:MAG: cation:proton antiporter [Phycisphaeraceae bacterium]